MREETTMIIQEFLPKIRILARKSKLTRSKLLRDLYNSGLRNRSIFRDLVRIYGFWTTLKLYKIDYISWKNCSLINKRISSLVNQMGDEFIEGSAIRRGYLYHDYALPETRLKAHRKNTANRLLLLKKHLPVHKARILDIGCSSGGVSLGLALLGALKLVGIDHDENAIRIARAVAEKYEIRNVEFYTNSLTGFDIPEVDIVVWLSQWMWIVKQQGLEYGKRLLFDIPKQSGASIMAFESAANDGMAAIPGTTQSDIEGFLRSWTPFNVVKNIGSFQDKWRSPGKERMVFICSEPQFTWRGRQANITRIDCHTIVKEYEPQYLWAKDLETRCFQRLDQFLHFPKLLEEGQNWIKIEWVGNRVTDPSELNQIDEIVRILSVSGIVHRDICPENLLYRDGQLFLVDFGWAIIDGQEPPAIPRKGLGRGFYEFGVWDDALAAKKVRAWFEEQREIQTA